MKFPWKGVALGSACLTILVCLRCIVTLERAAFYGMNNGPQIIARDPWFYIGMAAAAVCVAALLVLAGQESCNRRGKNGCEA